MTAAAHLGIVALVLVSYLLVRRQYVRIQAIICDDLARVEAELVVAEARIEVLERELHIGKAAEA